MTNKHFIGTEEGDAIAAFVQRVEEKTGKSLRAVSVMHIMQELSGGTPQILENRVSVSMDFFQTPPRPSDLKAVLTCLCEKYGYEEGFHRFQAGEEPP